MRRELVIPFELASRRIQSYYGIGIEIVPLALIPVMIGPWIADLPEQQIQFGVVTASEPGCAPWMCEILSIPGLGTGFAGGWNGPESPRFLACGLLESGEEPAHSTVAASDPGNNQIPNDERRGGSKIVQPVVCHLRFPQQDASETVQRNQVSVIRSHENTIARHRSTAVDFSFQTFRGTALIVPDFPSVAGIKGVALIRAGDVHDSLYNQRSPFERRSIGQ